MCSSMSLLSSLSVQQLRRAAAIKEKIQSLESQLSRLLGSAPSGSNGQVARKKKFTMSAAAKAKISAAAKARWAKIKGARRTARPGRKGKMSASAKAKLSARMKAVWAARKAGKR